MKETFRNNVVNQDGYPDDYHLEQSGITDDHIYDAYHDASDEVRRPFPMACEPVSIFNVPYCPNSTRD